MKHGNRLTPLSRKVLSVCTLMPQSMGEILDKLPNDDKDKVAHRVHHLVAQGFLKNHRSVRSYGGLFSLAENKKIEIKEPSKLLRQEQRFALYDVWR